MLYAFALLCFLLTYLGEVALAVADEQASLSAATVANHHNLLGVSRGVCDVCRC